MVERDIGQTIANVQCLLPARQHKIRHVQLVWRHDNNQSNQANQVGARFVLNAYSDDPDTSACMVGLNIPLPTETTEQIPLTPTASATVDTKDPATSDTRVMDDNDEIWTIEADHRTGWHKTFESGTYRGMLYGVISCDYPKQVVSLTKQRVFL